ncbi:unnamed protein product, partial [Cylindrotheca closterium]
MFQPSDMP